ncbi:MBL fold metallo-hydrolase [Dactylosporangium sp. NPDC000555]|uniref:MBL fold metallo-hydrolase n=1 Tax=Dactylosporangium sp. NPDC000555 TaxID=3154260 RepID=UPI0033219D19
MRLSDRVHLVGSGFLGWSLSDRHDSHVYLVDGGTEALLVDAGSGLGRAAILDLIERSAAPPVTRILVTHGHADHAAGAGALAAALDARVLASTAVARMLADADEVATGLAVARSAGTYPPHLRLTPTAVDDVRDEGSLRVGDLTVTVLPTPGHAAGHLCFLVTTPAGDRSVFTGDLVFARGRTAVLGTADTDLAQLRRSLRVVAEARPAALFPGHGSIALAGAGAHLDIALAAFDAGRLPPPLLP